MSELLTGTHLRILGTLIDDGEEGVRDLVVVLVIGDKGAQLRRLQRRIVGQPIAHNCLGHWIV